MKKLNFNTKNNKTLMRIARKKYVTLIDVFRKDVRDIFLLLLLLFCI
jgi:hypothetical protein